MCYCTMLEKIMSNDYNSVVMCYSKNPHILVRNCRLRTSRLKFSQLRIQYIRTSSAWQMKQVLIHLFQKSLSAPKARSKKLTTAKGIGTFSLFIYSSVDILITCIFKWPNSSKWLLFNARRDNFSSTMDKLIN